MYFFFGFIYERKTSIIVFCAMVRNETKKLDLPVNEIKNN